MRKWDLDHCRPLRGKLRYAILRVGGECDCFLSDLEEVEQSLTRTRSCQSDSECTPQRIGKAESSLLVSVAPNYQHEI